MDLATLPDGTLLLALNDNATARSPLSLASSRDGGATWRHVAVLEQDDAGNFHYPTVLYVPGRTRRERVRCTRQEVCVGIFTTLPCCLCRGARAASGCAAHFRECALGFLIHQLAICAGADTLRAGVLRTPESVSWGSQSCLSAYTNAAGSRGWCSLLCS